MNVSWDLVVMNIFVRILYVHIKIMESSTERGCLRTFKFQLPSSCWLRLQLGCLAEITIFSNDVFSVNHRYRCRPFLIIRGRGSGEKTVIAVLIILAARRQLLAATLQVFQCLYGLSIYISVYQAPDQWKDCGNSEFGPIGGNLKYNNPHAADVNRAKKKCKYGPVSVFSNVPTQTHARILTHVHCRCGSCDWWARESFQRASRSVTAVSTHTVNMKLSIPLSLSPSLSLSLSLSLSAFPFVLSLFSPSHSRWHISLSPSLSLSLPLCVSLSFHCGRAVPESIFHPRGARCQLWRYGNKNKTESHLKELCSVVHYRAGWKPICSGLGVQTKEGKQLQPCQCQDCISISTHWQKVQQLPQSPASKYD